MGRAPDPRRQGLCRRPAAGGDAREPRHADRARPQQPVPRSPVEENLDLFRRMRAGEFPNGARVLRAKIDMASGNINLRDPVLYRILHARTRAPAPTWCIYPSYDFAHGQSDAIEGVTHSLCTLEFEDHRPLYDWFIENLPVPSRPRQYEFARLNLSLHGAVEARADRSWCAAGTFGLGRSAHADACRPAPARRAAGGDPRFQAHRRRPCQQRGRDRHARAFDPRVPEQDALRRMAVLRPLKVVIENYPEGRPRSSTRSTIPRIRRGTRRCASAARSSSSATTSWRTRRRSSSACRRGKEVRLRYAYFITCREVVKNAMPARWSRCAAPTIRRRAAANAPDGRKVKATLHWVTGPYGEGAVYIVSLPEATSLTGCRKRAGVGLVSAQGFAARC
jgi:glutaminyl-tRNA synthetase